jgi:hypothetical protein
MAEDLPVGELNPAGLDVVSYRLLLSFRELTRSRMRLMMQSLSDVQRKLFTTRFGIFAA